MNTTQVADSRAGLLGSRVRESRKSRGLTGIELAGRAGVSQGALSKIEAGKLMPSIDLLCRLGAALDLRPDTLQEWLVDARLYPAGGALPFEFLRSNDVERFQLALEALEQNTKFLRVYQSQIIPGQLQTEEYATAIMKLVRTMSPEMRAQAVEARMRRQAFIRNGKQCAYVVTEDALRSRVLSGRGMAEQLLALKEFAALPNVELGVITWNTRVTATRPPSFYIYDCSMVHVELPHDFISLTSPVDIAVYEEMFASQSRMAVTGPACMDALDRIMQDHVKLDSQDAQQTITL